MKIYTKTGDDGTTSLIDGTRVLKCDEHLECYGSIDELNSYIGLIRDLFPNRTNSIKDNLLTVQNKLFVLCCDFSNEKKNNKEIPHLKKTDILDLEHWINEISEELPPAEGFILPTGNYVSSMCHITRTVCRRAERDVVRLSQTVSVNNLSTIYLNRLSDYLFVLARKALKDFNKSEITWNPAL